MTYYIKIGPLKCSLDKKTEYFWSQSEWKIDPFRVKEIQSGSDFEIKQEKQNECVGVLGNSLVYKEARGFFDWSVHQLNDENILFSLVRRSKNSVYLRYIVNADWDSITLIEDHTDNDGAVAFEYLAQIMPGVFLKHNLLTFHSALVEYQGQAFAVCAPSGTGKTTHARLWRDSKNALILNGDRAVMGKSGAGWTAYGTPWSGTSGEQINRHAPLKALVVLERAPQNSVERLQGLSAFGSVLPHLLYPAWDKPLAVTAIDGLNDLLETVPVYRLRCRPDAGAVDVLCRALYEG